MDLGQMIVTYTANINDLLDKDNQAKSSISSVADSAQSSGSNISSGFGKGIAGVLDFGAKIGATVIGMQGMAQGAMGLANALLQPNASMEQTTVGFQTLLGAGKATTDMMKSLQDFAAATPFEFPELATDAQHMLAFGFTAKEVIPTLTDIGDAMSAMGKGSADIDRVVAVFGQMKAAGKANAGDMMQLADQGIPAWKFLAEAMHKTIPEVQALSSKGLIPAQVAIDALTKGMHGMFGGGMAAQANTFNGLMSTLQDNAGAAMRAFTGPLFDAAKQGLTVLGNLVSSKQFQDFATNTGKNIATIFGQIGTFVSNNVAPALQKLGPIFQQIGNYIQSDNFQSVVADFQNLGTQIGKLIAPLLGVQGPAGDLVSNILPLLGTLFSGLVTTIGNVVSPIAQFVQALNDGNPWAQAFAAALVGVGVAMAVIKAASIIGVIVDFISILPIIIGLTWGWAAGLAAAAVSAIIAAAPFLLIGAAIAAVVAIVILAITHWGAIVEWLKGAWSNIVAFFTGLWNNIKNIFSGIGKWFGDRFNDAKNAIGNAFSNLGSMMHQKGEDAKNGFQTAMGNVGNWFKQQGKGIQDTAKNIGQGVVDGFNWMYQHNTYFKALVDNIVLLLHNLSTWITNTWNTIKDAVIAVWQTIVTWASSTWQTITDAISTAINTAHAFIVHIWTTVTTWIHMQWMVISSLAQQVWTKISDTIHQGIQTAVSWLQSIWNTAYTWLTAQWNKITTLASNVWALVSAVFSSIWNKYISKPLTDLWNSISKWFTDLGNNAKNSGTNFINMLVNGIKAGTGAIWDAVKGIANTIWTALGFHSPPAGGPLADSDKYMPRFIDILSTGLTAGGPKVATAAIGVAQQIAYPIKPSATSVAASIAPSLIAGAGGDHTTIVQLNDTEIARMVQKKTDRLVKLKLGTKGRSA